MKKYNRAQEKEKLLNSVNKYTIIDLDEQEDLPPRVSAGSFPQRGVVRCHRETYAAGRDQSGGSGSANRCTSIQCEQSDAPKISSDDRFFNQNRRKCRAGSRTEDQEENLNRGVSA